MTDQSCPINSLDLLQIEVVSIQPENRVSDYQKAMTLAGGVPL